MQESYSAVEICAGAGGQVLGLHQAGFTHELAVELDSNACNTLRENDLSPVSEGDVADTRVWEPKSYEGVSLLAGGVPCPPFTIAGKQLGATDERDLFAWAVEQVEIVRPRALLLENVRGLSMPRFAGYRQRVLDRLRHAGYVAEWQLLQASDFSVPQLRPRFVLVALKPEDAKYFHWPEPDNFDLAPTVGQALFELMGSSEWNGVDEWKNYADKIAPTVVGGSKKHGGADLGPTRAKRAWAEMHVDALGIADHPPKPDAKFDVGPKLTCDMVQVLQGFSGQYQWSFTGKKTSRYRQIGNAFPPPVSHAVGSAIIKAFEQTGKGRSIEPAEHDPIYRTLEKSRDFVSAAKLIKENGDHLSTSQLERHISMLSKDFDIEVVTHGQTTKYRLEGFRGFVGQSDHTRHEQFLVNRARIS